MSLKALIFDFDGLIVDTEQSIFKAYADIFTEYGAALSLQTWERIIGTTGRRDEIFFDLESQLGHGVNREKLRQQAHAYHHAICDEMPAISGVEDQVVEAKRIGLQLGIASSSTRRWVIRHLVRLDLLQHFDVLRTREDVIATKPSPEVYRSAMSGLGVTAKEAVALEDSPNGIASAKAAGLLCVAIPNSLTSGMSIDHADIRVSSIAALSLEDLFARTETES